MMTFLNRFLLLGSLVWAFSTFSQFVSITPKAGMGISNGGLYWSNSIYQHRFAPKFGLATEYRLSDKYFLKGEVYWNQERYIVEGKFLYDSGGVYMYKKQIVRPMNMDFLLALQKNFGRNRNWFWCVGTYTSYFLRMSTVLEYGATREVKNEKIASSTNRFLWGVTSGVGLKLPVSDKNKMLVEVRANWYGFGQHSSTSFWFNRLDASFWLLLGYEFGRKKS